MSRPDVYVIGGGFAGIQAARAVSGSARVFLLDRNPYATMVPALPDVLSGRLRLDALTGPLDPATGSIVDVIHEEVRRIDLEAHRIETAEQTLAYDYLIIANGSAPAYFGFQPSGGTLHSVHSIEAATRFRTALEEHLSRDPSAPVVIVGAGYTGLEVAACLRAGTRAAAAAGAGRGAAGPAARHPAAPRITVVERSDTVLGFLHERERERVLQYFADIDVDIRTGTVLEDYDGSTAVLSDGTRAENSLVCWAAGMRADPTPINGEVERLPDGRIRTTAALQLPGYPRVFAAGDAAALEKDGTVARRAVNFSFYSGRRAGRNVAAAIGGRRLRDFRPVDLGWIIPLGEESVGRVFGAIRVGRRVGLRMHYAMCGFRQFAGADKWEFYRTALHLRRTPQPLQFRAPEVSPDV